MGHKQTCGARPGDVRFTPMSRHTNCRPKASGLWDVRSDPCWKLVRRIAPGLRFIPACSDRDPSHRDYSARWPGAFCAAVRGLQAKRNAACGRKNPASGGVEPAIGCVAALARYLPHRTARRACPSDRFDAMRGVSITAGWYYREISDTGMALGCNRLERDRRLWPPGKHLFLSLPSC